MLRFHLFGFPIVVHWMFWITMALIGGADRASTPRGVQMLIGWVAAGFVSIVIHELGHAFAMRHYGDRRVGILLYAFGGQAQGSRWLSRVENIVISAAGPALQLVAGLLLQVLLSGWNTTNVFLGSFVGAFITVSIYWALFNLLPIYPMDGGHICRAFLGSERRRTSLIISMVCCIGLGFLALQSGSLFMALFLGMMAYNNWQEMDGRPQTPWMQGR